MATQVLEPVLQQKISHTAVIENSSNNRNLTEHHAPLTPVATNVKATMRTCRFWAIIVSLMVTGLVSALEVTIIISALPTIIEAIGGGDSYIWIPNAYLLASMAMLPLLAQASNIFGRRILLLGAVAIFTLDSGLRDGANSMLMLIAARTIQEFGGGGINLLIETVATDPAPLRERGEYMSIVYLGATFGATIGPFLVHRNNLYGQSQRPSVIFC